MRNTMILATALALTAPLALAQSAEVSMKLSYRQIQNLSVGLQAIENGSIEQCGPKSSNTPAPTSPCPYTKSVPLLVSIARNMVAVEGPLQAFSKAQEVLKKEVLDDPKMKGSCADMKAGVPIDKQSPACQEAASREIEAITPRAEALINTQVDLYVEPVKLADLNLAQNHIPASTLAQLSPIIVDWAPQVKK